ncbi:MAG: hypothetical protein FWG28_03315 [Clostridiales bacterium]|nr:hypothetical protein [Clostridiales bacterium]
MNFQDMYNAKKRSPEEAVSLIKNGDKVFTGGSPNALLKAMFDLKDTYQNVRLYSQFGMLGASGDAMYQPEMTGHMSFTCTTLPLSSVMNSWPNANLDQISLSFSDLERLIEVVLKPDVVLMSGCPMDDEGFISLGSNHGCNRAAVDVGAKVLIQIDSNMYNATTDYYRVHISEVEALCEFDNPIPAGMPARPLDERDKLIATFIAERVANGSTIQLGAGGVSNAMGNYLTEHKDLGIHAETLMSSLYQLIESGVVNNSKKPLMRGISVAGFNAGGTELMKLSHNNPKIMFKKLAWVNHPDVVSQIPNMVSINACLAADLRGQVCSESLGMGNTGGIGGQLDFVEGARRAPSGQSFLAMHSSVVTRKGDNLSKITMGLPSGSVATSPANDVMNIVTEYGVAEIWCKSAKERAKSMIRIAHPDFRDELTFNAKKHGLL